MSYREDLRRFVDAEVVPNVSRWESAGAPVPEVLAKLVARGLLAPCFERLPSGKSAVPLDVARYVVLVEELARARCFGVLLGVAIHVGVFLPFVRRFDKVVPEAWVGGIAVSEAAAGSDLLGLQTTLTSDGDGFVLSGEKAWVSNVPGASALVVLAKTRAGRHFAGVTAVLVPMQTPGVRCERTALAVMRTAAVGTVRFENVRLGADAVLGRKELGLAYFQEHIATERLAGAVWAVTVAELCLQEAQRFCLARVVGDGPLWSQSAVRQRIGRDLVQVGLLRALVEKTVRSAAEAGRVPALEAAMLKAAVAPAMESAIGTCLQLRGAAGFEEGSGLMRWLAELRVFGVAGGSTETMLEQVAELWRSPTEG